MKVTILGSGTSTGVPRIGDDWGACDPTDLRNRRLRASILVEHEDTCILVDSSPDMREQLLAARVGRVDAVIWTHDHADHCHGIDDLRQLYHVLGHPVPGYARGPTLAVLKSRFAYVFEGKGGYPATVEAAILPDQLTIGGIGIAVADQPHGHITSAGLRFDAGGKRIGYATDLNAMTDAMRTLYQDLDVLVIDALRHEPHPTHPTVAQALAWIAELKPRRAATVHMDYTLDYATLAAELPAGVEPGYDGLIL